MAWLVIPNKVCRQRKKKLCLETGSTCSHHNERERGITANICSRALHNYVSEEEICLGSGGLFQNRVNRTEV